MAGPANHLPFTHMSTLTGRLSLLLLVFAITAGPALAQRGFSLSPHVYGTGLAVGDLDDAETEEGGGLGLRLGLGLSKTVTLYFNAEGARIDADGELYRAVDDLPTPGLGRLDEDYMVASGEIGAQFNLLPSNVVNPFLRTGLRGTSIILDERGTDTEDDPQLRGGGVTLGGGIEARLSRKLAIEAALEVTGGAFNELETDDIVYRNFEDIEFGEGRVSVGLVWRPNAGHRHRRGRHRH